MGNTITVSVIKNFVCFENLVLTVLFHFTNDENFSFVTLLCIVLLLNMVHYKLVYFNARGRAEIARLMFAEAGVEYEDYRFEFSQWPAEKESE